MGVLPRHGPSTSCLTNSFQFQRHFDNPRMNQQFLLNREYWAAFLEEALAILQSVQSVVSFLSQFTNSFNISNTFLRGLSLPCRLCLLAVLPRQRQTQPLPAEFALVFVAMDLRGVVMWRSPHSARRECSMAQDSAMRPLKKKAYFSGKQVSPLNRPAAKLKIGSTAIKSDSGPGEIKI